ncbi:MAG: 3-demethylubiquinone-9 3-methyltransferase, partial [Firmicutes bacterium]|nr:3-demethylubiquinone-9 3-methyltransferase [Bacillota bacterium]
LYMKAFGLTLGYYEKFPDGTFMHAALLRDGNEVFAVSESQNDAFVNIMLNSSIKGSRPTMSYGLNFDSEDEVKRAYDMLSKDGIVLLPLGTLPWSPCCADVVDKYGVYWYITV